MCCFIAALVLAGPRLAILVWWLFNPVYFKAAFDHFIWGFLGWLLLPWTTLMYVAIYPGGIMGFDWILLGLGVFFDMALYLGGNADLYVLYDPCAETVRLVPVGASRVELVDEVSCRSP